MMTSIGRPIAAVFILCSVLVVAALSAFMGWADIAASQDEQQVKADFVPRSLQSVRQGVDAARPTGLAIDADTETLAAARVDALVRSITSDAGGSVLSSRADAKRDATGLGGRIEIVAVVEATNDILQDILMHLENGAPMLLVEGLTIQSEVASDSGPGQEPRLHADLIVDGYWDTKKK